MVTPRRVPLREVWPHEQYDFSSWVKANVDFLNDHLGVTLDAESLNPEVATGAFSADLVGEAVDDVSGEALKVVIENQLERTDHDHLGKVLTYCAHHDADAAVWIAGEARPEHVKAVQWLNDRVEDFRVWLFQVDAVAVDDTHVAPMLRHVVGPSILSEAVKVERRADHAVKAAQVEFWAQVLPAVKESCAALGVWQRTNPYASVHLWHAVPVNVGLSRLGYQMWVTASGSWACLRVDDADEAAIERVWQHLLANRAAIDAATDGELTWVEHATARNRQLRWDNPQPGGYRDDEKDWGAAGAEMAEGMRRLIAATLPVLRQLA